MQIRSFKFVQVLVYSLFFVAMACSVYSATTIDFRYGIMDNADCTNGAKVIIHIQQGDAKLEEVFAGETVGIGKWAPAQSVDISKFKGEITIIWIVDPIDGNIGCDWLVIEDPWLVVNGAKKYSFFDKQDDAEYTTVDKAGNAISYGMGKEGRDKMWDEAGCLFVHLPWSKEHGINNIPDAVEGKACERSIFFHPPQKGPTNAGTGAVKFKLNPTALSVDLELKLTTTWCELKIK